MKNILILQNNKIILGLNDNLALSCISNLFLVSTRFRRGRFISVVVLFISCESLEIGNLLLYRQRLGILGLDSFVHLKNFCDNDFGRLIFSILQPSMAGFKGSYKEAKVWQNMWEKVINSNWGVFSPYLYDENPPLMGWLGLNNVFLLKVLCKSHPVEFASYFHYCHSLTFDQRPDYGFLKRLFRDLFTREGIS